MFSGNTAVDKSEITLASALAAAREEAGLSDFGDDTFVLGLEKLIDCTQADVPFKPAGFLNFKATIQRFLVNRLRFVHDLKTHPEILEEDVSDPIMILGMPRTGTTKLQRLMSEGPSAQKLLLWKLLNPAPFPNEDPQYPEGRLAFAQIVEDATRANKTFTTSHETAKDEVDEDSYLALQGMEYWMLYHIFPSPSFLDWVQERPQLEAHAYEKRLLQYLQWQDGGRRGRRWILKNPGALGHIKTLKQVFPDISFVHSHRDLTQVLPSYCRLMEGVLEPLVEIGDLKDFGAKQISCWLPEFQRHRIQREELGDDLTLFDVSYLDIVKQPIDIARKAFENAGLVLTAETETAMAAWETKNQQHKHGKAVYSLERYGLSETMILDAFGERGDLAS